MFKHELKPAKGSNQSKKRLGRGTGSGLGTTSGKGHKGMKARAGRQVSPIFEGGQNPMSRRVPKRGFNNAQFATVYEVVNLKDIEQYFSSGDIVNNESLKARALIKDNKDGVKILGDGELTKALTFNVSKVSKSALDAISKSGGKVSLIPAFVDNEQVRIRKEERAAVRAKKLKAKK